MIAVRDDQKLRLRSTKRFVVACPLCGDDSMERFVKDGYAIRDCAGCSHRFAEIEPDPAHVQNHYGDEYFNGGGAGYSDYLAEGRLLRAHGRRYGKLLSRFAAPGRLLDVGAAAGFILQGFADAGWRGEGLEPNSQVAAHAREKLALNVQVGSLEEHRSDRRYDAISLIQVVPHFIDPMAAFESAVRLTKPGGLWVIETWNRASFTAQFFGAGWHEYSPPTVLHWFTPRTLKASLEKLGMRQVARGRPAKWIDGRHAKGLLRYKLGSSLLGRAAGVCFKMVPDALPIPYPAEDLFWAVFRKDSAN
jgi:2-polyprenyl-3-methyl-5-hydroxy-6-metoxy-1,4-benzoquinol methylase